MVVDFDTKKSIEKQKIRRIETEGLEDLSLSSQMVLVS